MQNSYQVLIKKYSQLLKDITHIPQKETEILLLHILKKDMLWLHINYHKVCDTATQQQLKKLVEKRATHYPLEYITSKTTFYEKEFIVQDGVLIPRWETEIIIDKAKVLLKNIVNPTVVEIGTGSGIISITLALLIKDIKLIAVDISDKALELAKKNAIKHKVDHKITFIKSNLFSNLKTIDFNMCISNPPYISNSYKLPYNVQYEPFDALFGGCNGDELLKKIIQETHKNNIQYLICEMGYDQKKSLDKFLQRFNPLKIKFYKDLSKFNRGFEVEFKI
ncbi:Protein-N(5)-glutamine methyltransferase PrmC, methylates polypeptide chain release factors RF1 and RF2 [hydrothermal vent metagenome]|uniref:peptide chain release factor N(5)-glutamine methyltransferase n=1 Tax=hydrothermal vent metagenome TaxID=652676 RepID=A0A3B1EA27_9ZZZZ